ncbi:hypothetical protein EW146_g4054 [Bondarzewia mesenterica]|uniref:PH domain-containing protein n=1 Tax=Bondarzewia mesenterica TaxID=1095465 RepID=A0A4S4LVM8_9AGAM|nr:hypothetical protein EW146_g4054 [Bondarzewia mesenterica]
MSYSSSDPSRTGPRSPLFGTATFSTVETPLSPSRYSYTSRSRTPTQSSDDSDMSSGHQMRRINVSPSPSTNRYSNSDSYMYSDDNSIDDAAEVEAALSVMDNELNQTEDELTEWSRGSSVTPSSYLSGSATSPTLTTTNSSFIPFTNTLRDGRILSTITERTENISSRPTSHNLSGAGSRPTSGNLGGARPLSTHARGATDSSVGDRPTASAGRRAGDLIAFFEDKTATTDSGSLLHTYGHGRTLSAPSGPRSPSPYASNFTNSFTNSQSMPTFGTFTGTVATSYGYGSGYGSRPSSPTKSRTTTTHTSSTAGPRSINVGGSTYGGTSVNTNTFTPSSYISSNTFTGTPTASTLRRPQASPRSPLTSVRNIVAAWKDRTPSLGKSGQSPAASVASSMSAASPPGEGFFSLRRRAERGLMRLRDRAPADEEYNDTQANRKSDPPPYDNSNRQAAAPSTPRSASTSLSSSLIPPPFDLAELGTFARATQEPTRIGLLWYLNVHAPPPYRWQRCQALLYPHMLLLSWIAQGGGRGVVTLDLLNCTEVRSVPSPTHPTAQDDVGTIAARIQSANAEAEGGGQLGEMGLMEVLCPFQLLYSDGVERLGAESARERVRWVSAIWEALDRSVTIPDRSETHSPTGSMRTIRSMTSSTHSTSASGSASTKFVPPMDTIPDISDFYSVSGASSASGLSRAPSIVSRNARAADDATVSNQTYLYPGDPRVIAPSRSSSLRRTTSMTDLDEEFASALRRARDSRPGLGFGLGLVGGAVVGDGSPVTVSSGPRLGRDVIITPPPSVGRGGDRSRTRGPTSESSGSISDEAFFSAGARSGANSASAYSLSSPVTSSANLRSTTETGTGLLTDEVLFGLTSASGTNIVPSTLSYRGTSSASYLGDSHPGTMNSSSFMPTSPSRTGLSRSRELRRRSRANSVSFSSSYPSEESSDKENSDSYTPMRSYTDDYSTRDDGLSTLETYTRDSWTRSESSTPFPVSSTEAVTDSQPTPSTTYETAHSPSIKSISDIPTIPSEYETAGEHDTDYETAPKCLSDDISTEFSTAEVCVSEKSSEYVTCPKCGSERSSMYSTAEVCPTEASTEYETAVCRCQAVAEDITKEVSEPEQEVVKEVSKEPSELSYLDLPLTTKEREEEESALGKSSEEESVMEKSIVEESVAGESMVAPSETPTIPSLLSDGHEERPPPENIPLPPSVYSPSLLSSMGLSELDLDPTVPTPSSLHSLTDDVPSESLPGPSPIGPPDSIPTTSLLSSLTESSISPTQASAPSALTPSSLHTPLPTISRGSSVRGPRSPLIRALPARSPAPPPSRSPAPSPPRSPAPPPQKLPFNLGRRIKSKSDLSKRTRALRHLIAHVSGIPAPDLPDLRPKEIATVVGFRSALAALKALDTGGPASPSPTNTCQLARNYLATHFTEEERETYMPGQVKTWEKVLRLVRVA